jgi:hypothetical protein
MATANAVALPSRRASASDQGAPAFTSRIAGTLRPGPTAATAAAAAAALTAAATGLHQTISNQ